MGKANKRVNGTAVVIDARELMWASDVTSVFGSVVNFASTEPMLKTFTLIPDRYVTVFCNWVTPDKTGTDLLEIIRDYRRANFLIPFILLLPTDRLNELMKDIAWVNELGVNDIISWPFTIEKTSKKVHNFIDFYDKTKECRDLLHEASSHIVNGNFDDATLSLTKFDELEDNKYYAHWALFLRAKMEELNNNLAAAEELYKESMTTAAQRGFAQGRQALIDIYIKSGRFDDAMAEAEDAHNMSPLNPKWKIQAARLYLFRKEFKKANEIYDYLVARKPENQFYINEMVENFKKEQSLSPADLNPLTEEQQQKIDENLGRVKQYLESKMYDQAIRSYLAIMDIDPGNSKKYNNILGALNWKWYKTLKSSGQLKNNYKPLVESVDYLLNVLRMDCTDLSAKKLLVKIAESEDEKLLDKVLEPRISIEMDRYVRDYI